LFVAGLRGFPKEDGTVGYIYEGVYENIVAARLALLSSITVLSDGAK
jgi:hypothetical protein